MRAYQENFLTTPNSFIELGMQETGYSFAKTWDGVDSPKVDRPYRVVEWVSRPARTHIYFTRHLVNDGNGGLRVIKVRREKPIPAKIRKKRIYDDKRRKGFTQENPYAAHLTEISSFPTKRTDYTLDSSVYPPVGGRISAVTEVDSFSTWRDGFVVEQLWDNNSELALLGRLRNRIAGSDFNMGVFLGEGRESLQMIARTATTLATALTRLKRGEVAGAARALGVNYGTQRYISVKKRTADNLSARWLELQYGWLPLIGDAESAAIFLAARLNQPAIQRYRARIRVAARVTPGGIPWQESGCIAFTRGQIIAELFEASDTKLVGLQDPASVAWELLPWSFVADWFLPIGNYLQARALNSALSGRFVRTITTVQNSTYSGLDDTPSGSPYYPYQVVWQEQPRCAVMRKSVIRTIEENYPVPLPSFKRLRDVPSWKRAANAVSLLTQVALGGSYARYAKWGD